MRTIELVQAVLITMLLILSFIVGFQHKQVKKDLDSCEQHKEQIIDACYQALYLYCGEDQEKL